MENYSDITANLNNVSLPKISKWAGRNVSLDSNKYFHKRQSIEFSRWSDDIIK